MTTARKLASGETKPKAITIGVVGTCDPRVDEASRQRAGNIVKTIADLVAAQVRTPDGKPVDVVWTPVLVDGEPQADIVGRQFREAGVDALICAPDTWAFPQLTLISILAHLPPDVPVNITCGNSGPKPGVVYAHAVNGALAQSSRLTHLNVGTWPDTGDDPKPTDSTVAALIDWAYAAVTYAGLKGRRVVVFGHDSMGMETALTHVIPTRQTFGLEVTRLDMKLLADMLNKGAYDKKEVASLRGWIDLHIGKRLDLSQPGGEEKFNQSLALYLIIRDLMAEALAMRKYFYGDFYPLLSFSLAADAWAAWQYDRPDLGEGMVVAFRRHESSFPQWEAKLQGLDSDANYELHSGDNKDARHMSGSALMTEGFVVTIGEKPGSALFTYKRAD